MPATYLRALTTADAGLAVSLFADDGVVHSPLYGPRTAEDSYPGLFADTSQANLTLKSVMTGANPTGQTTVSFWFHFDWRLSSGAAAPLDVVDVATIGPHGLIKELHIIYDTVDGPSECVSESSDLLARLAYWRQWIGNRCTTNTACSPLPASRRPTGST